MSRGLKAQAGNSSPLVQLGGVSSFLSTPFRATQSKTQVPGLPGHCHHTCPGPPTDPQDPSPFRSHSILVPCVQSPRWARHSHRNVPLACAHHGGWWREPCFLTVTCDRGGSRLELQPPSPFPKHCPFHAVLPSLGEAFTCLSRAEENVPHPCLKVQMRDGKGVGESFPEPSQIAIWGQWSLQRCQ